MLDFNRAFPVIYEHEVGNSKNGGFVDDPDDSGGATKYGISIRFLKNIGQVDGDIDGDGDVDVEDIKKLTEEEAKELYIKYFFNPLKCSEVNNELLALHILDHGVNAGIGTATKLIQEIVSVKVDGDLGPKTLKAINEYQGKEIVNMYIASRQAYYIDICVKNKKNYKFLNGWLKRVKTTVLE